MPKTIVPLCLLLIGLAPSLVQTIFLEKLVEFIAPEEEEGDKNTEFVKSNICLGPLGCFSNEAPFYDPPRRPISPLPFDRKTLDVQFRLYTPKNPTKHELISEENAGQSNFNPELKTYFFIHGFLDNVFLGQWLADIVESSLKREECNVIIVDWARANLFPYFQAVANTRAVGAETAHLIKTLQVVKKADPGKMHVIGHSLGAHTAGYVGQVVKNLGRITGLDPAGPYYTGTDPIVKLDPTDAKFVDIIHSDASLHLASGLGTVDRGGHIDFFPNNGNDQPGCEDPAISWGSIRKVLENGLIEGTRQSMACDHQRAVTLYAESILPEDCMMVGLACTSWEDFLAGNCGDCGVNGSRCAVMGKDILDFYNSTYKKKKYYLLTGRKSPFCLHQYHITVELANDDEASIVHGKADIEIHGSNKNVKAKLSRSKETFKPGSSHTYLVTSKKSIGEIGSVDFHWKKAKDKSRSDRTIFGLPIGSGDHESEGTEGDLYVRAVKISPLALPTKTGEQLVPRTLCGKGVTAIPSGSKVTLQFNTNC